jgi:heterodisulfide reductase subunit C
MDRLPSQVIRLAQLGVEDVLASNTPWICAACLMCQARCPKGVDIPRIMEALRQIALRRDHVQLVATQIDPDLLATAPQMAVVGALRKAGK